MKEPIKPEDIRAGDLIRWESEDEPDRANEYRAEGPVIKVPGRHFLLDRPTPAVDLPTEPTLGWLTSKYGGSVLGTWERYESSVRSRIGEASALVRERDLPLQDVAEFVEAVAVPKAALDEFRHAHHLARLDLANPTAEIQRRGHAMQTFLAAIDAANGDAR